MGRKFFDFFIFSSIYIAFCAWLMVNQTNQLLRLDYDRLPYFAFVFFSTICSYNFHWYLTPDAAEEKIRVRWTQQHKTLHFSLFFAGLAGSAIFFFYLKAHWFWMSGAIGLTFLYSAPKISFGPFRHLRKIAYGKTIFLAFVWMYVTTLLPILIAGKSWALCDMLFCVSRFFLIYAICIIFDYRDRLNDKREGVRSMITYFNETGINILFYVSVMIFALSTAALMYAGFTPWLILVLLLPGFITFGLYKTAKSNFSDYLYYFVLDGLMMLSSLITLLIPF